MKKKSKKEIGSARALNLRIDGGHRLRGTVVTRTSKNGAVGLLCASLLNHGTTTLVDVPRIEEVFRVLEVLESIGVKAAWHGSNLVITPPKELELSEMNERSARVTRSVIMLLGPLIHHARRFRLPLPTGCRLGDRTTTPHVYALEKLGVSIHEKKGYFQVETKKARPAEIVLYESGDTVTENVLIAAALIPGTTTIKYASANYQVQEMCYFLERLGVSIEGVGTTTLVVRGRADIKRNVRYELAEDPIESMFFIAVAAVTRSSLTIERCPIEFLELELEKLSHMGFRYGILRRYKARNGKTALVDIRTAPSTLIALRDKIECRPYPGLNIDNLPFFAVIATQAKGETLIHDWVYEERAVYYKELDKLGANMKLADPHRLFVRGPTPLKAAEAICPPALRPAAILLIGMLAAKGTSILRNVYSINRGYEYIAERLNAIGAKISILDERVS
ncbi:MAG: UDP-N-acetylglucosamine 1-carboxyvinyltransferase [bacterium]|nr:UDP-N-acetylglucosamine 1-carboxyvinyltransferase [bacterium]